jgi:hypothetical protein
VRSRRGPRDWFSIVATDVFCGLLCAVIVFDATSRKLPYFSAQPAAVNISYDTDRTADCTNEVVGVLFRGDGGSEVFYTTRGADGGNSGSCNIDVQVPDISELNRSNVMLIDGPSNTRVHLFDEVTNEQAACSTESGNCQ